MPRPLARLVALAATGALAACGQLTAPTPFAATGGMRDGARAPDLPQGPAVVGEAPFQHPRGVGRDAETVSGIPARHPF